MTVMGSVLYVAAHTGVLYGLAALGLIAAALVALSASNVGWLSIANPQPYLASLLFACGLIVGITTLHTRLPIQRGTPLASMVVPAPTQPTAPRPTAAVIATAVTRSETPVASSRSVLPSGILLFTQDTALSGAPGEVITVPLDILNNTSKFENLRLRIVSIPPGWVSVFLSRGSDTTEFELVPGKDDDTITFQITPPATAAAGLQRITIQAVTDDGQIAQLELGISISANAGSTRTTQ